MPLKSLHTFPLLPVFPWPSRSPAGCLPAGGPEELWGHFQPVFFQLVLNHQQDVLMLEQIPEQGAAQERFGLDKNILQGSQDQSGVPAADHNG